MVQWLRVPVSTAGSTVSIPIGTKILYATWCSPPPQKKLKIKLKMTFTDTTLYRSQVLFLLCYTYPSPHNVHLFIILRHRVHHIQVLSLKKTASNWAMGNTEQTLDTAVTPSNSSSCVSLYFQMA